MSRLAKICCHEIMPRIDRRSVLAGIAGLVAFSPLVTASAKDELRLADLVGPDGHASDLARSMMGQRVEVRGYLAPSLDGIEFTLSESSPGVCQLCGALHDPGARISIRSASPESSPPVFEPVLVEGRLALSGPEPLAVLENARTRTA